MRNEQFLNKLTEEFLEKFFKFLLNEMNKVGFKNISIIKNSYISLDMSLTKINFSYKNRDFILNFSHSGKQMNVKDLNKEFYYGQMKNSTSIPILKAKLDKIYK